MKRAFFSLFHEETEAQSWLIKAESTKEAPCLRDAGVVENLQ